MELAAIRTFCRAVETGNLSRAATALGVTKSVTSRRIQALEEHLGVRLLQRTTRGVTPTDEGTRFYEHALQVLDTLDEVRQALAGDDGGLTGRLRLTAPRAFTDLCLRVPLGSFMAAHPGLALEIHLADERVDIAAAGYDIGLRIARSLDDTALIARKLIAIRNDCVASPAYLAAHGTPENFSALDGHQTITYANVAARQQWQFETPEGVRSVGVNSRITSNSGLIQSEAALCGQGIAVLPRFFVADALARGDLVALFGDTPPLASALYALTPDRRFRPRRVSALIEHLEHWFRDGNNRLNL